MLQQARELIHRKSCLSDQRSKSAFGEFFMVGNGKAPVRRIGVSKNDVAAVLLIEFVSSFPECLDCVYRKQPVASHAGNLNDLFENARRQWIAMLPQAL